MDENEVVLPVEEEAAAPAEAPASEEGQKEEEAAPADAPASESPANEEALPDGAKQFGNA